MFESDKKRSTKKEGIKNDTSYCQKSGRFENFKVLDNRKSLKNHHTIKVGTSGLASSS